MLDKNNLSNLLFRGQMCLFGADSRCRGVDFSATFVHYPAYNTICNCKFELLRESTEHLW